MPVSRDAAKRLGTLLDQADQLVREVIRARGGNAANVRKAGHWADRTLGETAQAAVDGDRNAASAIKIAKEAERLSQQH